MDLNKENSDARVPNKLGTDFSYKWNYIWIHIICAVLVHIGAIYALWLTPQLKVFTILSTIFFAYLSHIGMTLGAHRLYSHKAFKANYISRFILMILQTTTGQVSIYTWARDHRLHHKFTDTDADPYNAQRGLFFSHIGWFLVHKHPLVKEKGKTINLSDVKEDPVVQFQQKYYIQIYLIFSILLPTFIPVYFWKETLLNSFLWSYVLRYVLELNITLCINSIAHKYGTRPYDKNELATNNKFYSFFALGEGWHNYHHVFPSDYKAGEFGSGYNISASLIEFFAYLGFFSDLKTAQPDMIVRRVLRTGDGTHDVVVQKTIS